MDLALDTRTHDLVLTPGPFGVTLAIVDGRPAIAQRIKIALLSLLGEWRYDVTHGTPWFQAILIKGAAQSAIAGLLRARILSVPGVLRLSAFRLDVDGRTRSARVDFTADTRGGTLAQSIALNLGRST